MKSIYMIILSFVLTIFWSVILGLGVGYVAYRVLNNLYPSIFASLETALH